MTSRERLQVVLGGGIPDRVPVTPDISNMIPAKRTGKPFWDIYLYQDPPLWRAFLDCVVHFGFDSLMDGYVDVRFEELGEIDHEWTEVIVQRRPDRIVTQLYREANGRRFWSGGANVYFRDNPPAFGTALSALGLPETPPKWEPVEGRRELKQGEEAFLEAKEALGDRGLLGVYCGTTKLIETEQQIYDFYDDPEKYHRLRDERLEAYEKRFERLMRMKVKPDFIATGSSGTLIHQTPATFRELGLPIAKRITALSRAAGLPSHVHSCGPEKALIQIMAEETDLTVIDPLEIPPMGDCDLAEIKRLYGERLVLKGNLHTTSVMLRGSPEAVLEASRRAIDDAAAGGRFILSTGDQCGRDTPEENLLAMIETAKTYGRY